jgi:hypothetical protein
MLLVTVFHQCVDAFHVLGVSRNVSNEDSRQQAEVCLSELRVLNPFRFVLKEGPRDRLLPCTLY